MHDWPRKRLLGLDEAMPYGQGLAHYLRFADRPIGGIDGPAAAAANTAASAAANDQALANYIDVRVMLTDHVYYFYGRPGLDRFNRTLGGAAHREAMARLARRIVDPAFKTATFDREAVRTAAAYPFAILPCGGRRTEGS